mmetsp:Transcript_3463/g.13834  ORF Transcript_3463/g.13834 Transcript_3463/m.13834 type:complete len:359 (+) Transcript_3463:173-1249(+)
MHLSDRPASRVAGRRFFRVFGGRRGRGVCEGRRRPLSLRVASRFVCVCACWAGGWATSRHFKRRQFPPPSLSPPRRRGSNDSRAQNNSSTGLVIALSPSPELDVFGPNDSITAMGSAELLRLASPSPGTKAFADAVIFLPIERVAAALDPLDAGTDAGGGAPDDDDIAVFFTSALSSSSSPKSMPLESTTSDTVSPIIASVTTSGRLINPPDPEVLIALTVLSYKASCAAIWICIPSPRPSSDSGVLCAAWREEDEPRFSARTVSARRCSAARVMRRCMDMLSVAAAASASCCRCWMEASMSAPSSLTGAPSRSICAANSARWSAFKDSTFTCMLPCASICELLCALLCALLTCASRA